MRFWAYKNLNFFILIGLMSVSAYGQFTTTNDAANLGGGYYRLTEDVTYQIGYIWNKYYYDLTTPLSIQGKFNFGSHSAGADGICFVLQDNCAGASGSSAGGGIGYYQMPGNSIAIEFDTYQNITGTGNQDNADPTYDHIAVEKAGVVNHADATNTLMAPVQMSATLTNVKDGAWHDFTITYDPTTNLLEVYFDGSLRVSYTYDIINNIFGGNSFVYWGFSSSTGGSTNYQEVYINSSTTSTSPLKDTTMCRGSSVAVNLPPLTAYNGKDLAINHPSLASSLESGATPASQAFDGNMTTRWSSAWSDPQWIMVDLGAVYDIDSVALYWESAYATQYKIQYSADTSVGWTDAFVQNAGTGGHETIIAAGTNIRYVRMYGTQRATGYGYSLWEMQVYGKAKYVWSPNNGTITPDIYSSSPTFAPTTTTTYKVTIPDPCLGSTTDSFIVTINCTLPVIFNSFEVENANGYRSLSWVTSAEINVSDYSVERSDDGIHFYSIAKMIPKNSSGLNTFMFKDYNSFSGTVYYRIAEQDQNGQSTYSVVRSVVTVSKAFQISPNPNNGLFTVKGFSGEEEEFEVTIVNVLGEIIFATKVSSKNNSLDIDISNYDSGMYLIFITSGESKTIQKIQKL